MMHSLPMKNSLWTQSMSIMKLLTIMMLLSFLKLNLMSFLQVSTVVTNTIQVELLELESNKSLDTETTKLPTSTIVTLHALTKTLAPEQKDKCLVAHVVSHLVHQDCQELP
eukprot:TRINITY_DN3484_c0_g1_i1.p2 TRINITY_DN3484_c0_g1~~TRINITY_DN3484_c0_g1_i1.p2  ORF type:complete len:111 (+),score=8.75 TRINITY_DN3484_c0_g1_i1:130-462(+)